MKIEAAFDKLASYAEEFLKGNMPFGNPVTDFVPQIEPPNHSFHEVHSQTAHTVEQGAANPKQSVTDAAQPTSSEGDDRGFLDHLIEVNDGYTSIAQLVEGVAGDLQGLTQSLETATRDFQSLGANPNASTPTAAQRVARRLGRQIGLFTPRLKAANAEYADTAQGIENSLEFLVGFYREQSEVTDPEVEKNLASLRELLAVAEGSRDSFNALADTMDDLPLIERRLNHEVTRSRDEIRAMAGNIDKTIASISRALRYYS